MKFSSTSTETIKSSGSMLQNISLTHRPTLPSCRLKHLQRDFEEFDKKIHEGREAKLSLEVYYNRRKPGDPFVKVRICCRKSMLALYMTSNTDPDKLIIFSDYQSRHRTYWVKSLHIACYAESRNFLDRYRLRAAVQLIIEREGKQTSSEGRTIDWFVRRYIEVPATCL
ncbi:hypothetical protein CPC08DRAFT_99834 [Agrocybe pediades]|nr:hypothetical protein CPC08DRAFT_99834 [Agrocybe pediades]